MIKNLSEIIKESIPELEDINYRSENGRNWLSLQQWNARLRSIENRNIKLYGRTITASSMQNYFHECIYEWEDNKYVLINEKAYKLIREFLTSQKFNTRNIN
jgi:hypothetical protein